MTVSKPNLTPGCMLTTLAHPALSGALPGLDLTPATPLYPPRLKLNPASFQCCNGIGQRSVAPNQEERCSLKERLYRLKLLAGLFAKTWGDHQSPVIGKDQKLHHFQPVLPREIESTILNRLLKVRDHRPLEECRGLAKIRQEKEEAPSFLWGVAAAAIWRYGLHVHMVTLGKSLPLPDHEGLKKLQLVLVEGVDRLWDPRQADDFEQIIALGDRGQLPVWMELGSVQGGNKLPVGRRTAMRQRVEKLKQADPLSWLGPSARSRLPFLTEGISSSSSTPKRPSKRDHRQEIHD